MEQFANENELSVDQLDRLPDELLHLILNRVRDAKSLTRCLAVSKRLSLLVPRVNSMILAIPPKPVKPKPNRGFPFNLISKSARFLRRVIAPKSSCSSRCSEDGSYYDPNEIIKHFGEVSSLDIEIPSCGAEIDGSLLKWVAEFGAGINGCAILGADSLERRGTKAEIAEKSDGERQPEPALTDKELKTRIVWIISCLIAASSRHVLLKELIGKNPKLEEVKMTDAGKQGMLCLGKGQVNEVRSLASLPETEFGSVERSELPDLKMKLWYLPEVELPETGFVMKGATLVVIRPSKEDNGRLAMDDGEGSMWEWFGKGAGEGEGGADERGKAFGEAVREMKKMKMKKSFILEMNSF